MAEKTKRGKIPSIKITKNFLKNLGSIVESEVNERIEQADIQAEEEILRELKSIDSRTYYKDENEREQAKEETKVRVRERSRPHIRLNYSIDAKNEKVTFGSIAEVIDTTFFPTNIESFACRVSHYGDNEYVDIDLDFSQRWYGINADFDLSSSSEQRLLKIESDLRKLFESNQTEYKFFLYPTEMSFYLVPRLASAVLSLAVVYLSYKHFDSDLNSGGAIGSLLWLMFVAFYFATMGVIKWTFPYFKFEITNDNFPKKSVRLILGIVATALIGGAIYDVVKNLVL